MEDLSVESVTITTTVAIIQCFSTICDKWIDRETDADKTYYLTDEQLAEVVLRLNTPNPSKLWRGIRRTIATTDVVVAPWTYVPATEENSR